MPSQIISCSALILNERRDRILISRRSQNRRVAAGLWEVVGGRLEFGEEPEACLRRELREELGVEVVEPALFGVYSCQDTIGGEPVHLISVVYTCRLSGIPTPEPREIAELRWVGPGDIAELPFAANCGRRVADYFAAHA